MKKYQPSNGSEGDWFVSKYCMNCLNCNPDPNGSKQCEILAKTMVYDSNDDDYPSEWTFDDLGSPICTSWVRWNWGQDGDPDDHNNPNAPISVGPNQIEIFPYYVPRENTNQTQIEYYGQTE